AVPPTQTPTPEPAQTESANPPPSSAATSTLPPSSSPSPSVPRATTTNAPSNARLALIVDDCGQWIDTERGFLALDIPLTMSVLPDVHYTTTIAREAAGAGKGVMLHLPMETVSGLDPGPGKVTTEMSDAQIDAQVEGDLAQIPQAQGVNNHEGSKGSADPRVMRDVVGVLAKHGDLFFVDSRTSTASVGEQSAQAAGIPTAARDVFLDNQASMAYTEAQLRAAAAIAKRNGTAIAIGHPHATTLAAVRALIPELEADGVQFVLAQDLVSTPSR
ncbi:MAG: divergent polysaccharide deacetylase family protein, partial [Candidatus Eremiobacteraeota bacterium]|nr:divergent polysaccharide deacetylase family protein [Candidatus Eremiobacteraeota bacterium]